MKRQATLKPRDLGTSSACTFAKLVEPLLRPMALAAFVVLDGSLLAPRRAPQPPPELRAGARRRGAPCMVSERHNLAYKETM